ncbi:MAG: hypothetical protein MZV70_39440 [Desulfobacterales bacterium]|nr:hypothetical protein [Desulfobacterales bacterium]
MPPMRSPCPVGDRPVRAPRLAPSACAARERGRIASHTGDTKLWESMIGRPAFGIDDPAARRAARCHGRMNGKVLERRGLAGIVKSFYMNKDTGEDALRRTDHGRAAHGVRRCSSWRCSRSRALSPRPRRCSSTSCTTTIPAPTAARPSRSPGRPAPAIAGGWSLVLYNGATSARVGVQRRSAERGDSGSRRRVWRRGRGLSRQRHQRERRPETVSRWSMPATAWCSS